MAQYCIVCLNKKYKMKKNLSILIILVLILVFTGYGQDSLRTRNDKPGTPQSLRSPDQTPQSRVTIVNTNTPPTQNVIHGSPESNKVNNTGQTIVNTPVSPITTVPADTTITNSAIQNGVSNSPNPIRRQ